jgi:hypothetical protein
MWVRGHGRSGAAIDQAKADERATHYDALTLWDVLERVNPTRARSGEGPAASGMMAH